MWNDRLRIAECVLPDRALVHRSSFIVHRSSFIVDRSSFIVHRSSLRMWNDRLRIAERVLPEWAGLTAEEQSVVRRTLEIIDEDPIIGAPLFDPLRGYWSLHADGL